MIHEEININADGCEATLTTYLLSNSPEIDPNRVRPLVILCPGGGYRFVSAREAEPIAIQLNAMGIHVAILRYSIYPAKFPTALTQLAKSVAYARKHAKEWNVRKDRIIVMGFSAGGHLAASLGTLWHEPFLAEIMQTEKGNYRPDGMLLCYPVITSGEYAHRDSFRSLLQERYDELVEEMSLERRVTEFTPPTFLWHTFEDGAVPVENALFLAQALNEKKVPFELHVYPKGGHGLALATEETRSIHDQGPLVQECQNWISMAGTWVKNL
ncbi:acetyl esterase/lipase [Anaerotaenia torta]|uniref:alpha/beta hydrolase n=1 Tax=Anaerotaenia torta TaxID=433293 RepID=UPI003D1FB305